MMSPTTLEKQQSGKYKKTMLPTHHGHEVMWRKLVFLLVIVGFDKIINVNAEEQYLLKTFTGHTRTVYTVAWSPDGNQLASGGGDWNIHLWEVSTGKELHELREHTNNVYSVAWSPNGEHLASGSGSIRIWDPNTGQNLQTLDYSSLSVSWSPDGTKLVSGSSDSNGTIPIWDTNTGEMLQVLEGVEDENIHSVAWSPDGDRFASGGAGGTARIWDAATGELMHNLTGRNAGSVYSVAWNPDGTKLATVNYDGKVRVWDAGAGRLLQTLSGHSGSAFTVAWSPNGLELASGGRDRSARIWDASSGEEARTLTGHGGWIRSVTWSPDGTQLASGSDDTTVRIWAASSQSPMKAPTPNPTTTAPTPGPSTPSPTSPADKPSYSTDPPSLAPTERPSIAVTIDGIKLTFTGVGELDRWDLEWFESVTTTWCEQYFSTENQATSGVRELRTMIRVTNQNVASATISSGTTKSNTVIYEQDFEYYLADENAPIIAEDLVTAPFIAPLNNRLYLSRLAKNGTAFESIDTQMSTIPQLPDTPVEDEDSGSSGGSTAVIGAIAGVLLGVLLVGTLAYRWKSSAKNKEHEPVIRLNQTRESESQEEPDIPFSPVSPGSSPEVSHSSDSAWAHQTRLASVPEFNDLDSEEVNDSSEGYVLQNKDQSRSVSEYAMADAVPMPY